MAEPDISLGSLSVLIGHHGTVERALELVSKSSFLFDLHVCPCQSLHLYSGTIHSILLVSQAKRIKWDEVWGHFMSQGGPKGWKIIPTAPAEHPASPA